MLRVDLLRGRLSRILRRGEGWRERCVERKCAERDENVCVDGGRGTPEESACVYVCVCLEHPFRGTLALGGSIEGSREELEVGGKRIYGNR